MNERIKQLADQAGVSITAADKNGVFTLLPDNQKKFAELIIRECGNYMNSRVPGNIEVSATVAKMKQHFGVEE